MPMLQQDQVGVVVVAVPPLVMLVPATIYLTVLRMAHVAAVAALELVLQREAMRAHMEVGVGALMLLPIREAQVAKVLS